MNLSKEEKLKLLEIMLKIRIFEERAGELYREGRIPGFIHLYIGEEAVASGICANLRRDDYIVSTHRGHGHCIAKGADLNKLMAELFGKESGYSKGRGGSMHIFAPEVGVLGTCGIVGAGIPLALGPALKAKLRRTDQVSVAFFSDGASNQGTFHESLNLAALWKLPVIFVCENNLYATSVSVGRSTSVKDIATRSVGYDMPGIIADGMDVLDVYQKGKEAMVRAREGRGPTLIECKTYRFHGHYEGDPGTDYRTNEEVEKWKEKDPILSMKERLFGEKIIDEEEFTKVIDSIKSQVEEAVQFAVASPFPRIEQALNDVL